MLMLFPKENFPSEIFGLAFSLLFVIILFFELRILLRCKSKESDKGSMLFVLVGIFLPLALMIFLSYVGFGRIGAGFINYIGLVLLVWGFLLRQVSIMILGKYFIPVVSKQRGQRIIEVGPYEYIRHPSYTGLMLELLGVAFALANWISVIIVLSLFLPAIYYRIKVEEEFLRHEFKEYSAYMKRTWRLIPFVY